MPEQLLKPMEVADRLKLSRTAFYAARPKLIAKGLKAVQLGKHIKYLESSLDRIIQTAVENDTPLF